ncbi:MAG: type I-U CRISPR-associated protein Csb2 [Candidatus Brachytrichaceae bacterium NZ_4S206]|jgi:CRISPR-associated protein Csb2
MAVAIALSFPTGRYHATGWGRHVNEAAPDWPPAPWRLFRAFAAVWKRTLAGDALVNEHLPSALGKLTAPPLYKLPPATLAHTRHYMTQKVKGDADLIFDGFIALTPDVEVGVLWPEAELTGDEQEALGRVLARLSYLGRAEAWCAARLANWDSLDGAPCAWVDADTGEIRGPTAERTETVRLLCLDPENWNRWSYGRKAHQPDPKWNLLAETPAMHNEGWSDPPGSRWVTYLRPANALTPPPPARKRAAREETRPRLLRFALDGPVLPRVTETVYVAELARKRVQGIFGNLFEGAASPLFSGKQANGTPLAEHRHAFFLPTDEDNDGKLEHILLYAAEGFGPRELCALDAWRKTRGPGGVEMNVVWLGAEDKAPSARIWRSATPFIATRHYKERGAKRDAFPRWQLPEVNLREEIQRRGLPAPVRVEGVDELQLAGRPLAWRHFRQQRVLGNGRRGNDFGKGFEIEFAEPVSGPLALGYACHFGLGLFLPADTD